MEKEWHQTGEQNAVRPDTLIPSPQPSTKPGQVQHEWWPGFGIGFDHSACSRGFRAGQFFESLYPIQSCADMEIDAAKPDSFSAYNPSGCVPRSIAYASADEAGRASIIPSRYLRADQASAEFGPLAQTYAASLMRSDPPTDALIESLHRTHRGAWWPLVLAALSNGIESVADAPAELRAFIAALPPEPTPEEWELIEWGGAAGARTRFSAGRALHCAALMVDYWSSAFSKPLEMTGQL